MNAKLVESLDPQMGMKVSSTASSNAQDGESCGEQRPLPTKDNQLYPTSYPLYTQDSMWEKVQRYLQTHLPALVLKEFLTSVLVQSSSGAKPH